MAPHGASLGMTFGPPTLRPANRRTEAHPKSRRRRSWRKPHLLPPPPRAAADPPNMVWHIVPQRHVASVLSRNPYVFESTRSETALAKPRTRYPRVSIESGSVSRSLVVSRDGVTG